MEKEQLIKATQVLQKHVPNRFPLINSYIDAMQEYAEWYHEEQSKKCSIPTVSGAVCECNNLPKGEIAISSKALTDPNWTDGQTER